MNPYFGTVLITALVIGALMMWHGTWNVGQMNGGEPEAMFGFLIFGVSILLLLGVPLASSVHDFWFPDADDIGQQEPGADR